MAVKYRSKNECLKFIKKVENKALNSIEKQYQPLKEEIENKVAERLEINKDVKRMKDLIIELIDLETKVKSLNITHSDDLTLRSYIRTNNFHYLDNAHDKCLIVDENHPDRSKFESDFIYYLFKNRFLIQTPEYLELVEKEKQELSEVKENYKKVYDTASSLKNGSQVAKFLKDLGFDITTLIVTEEKFTIDTEKLFVCGERK